MKTLRLPIYSIGLFLVLTTCLNAEISLVSEEQLAPSREHKRTTRIITRLLSNYHYKPAPLTDAFSIQILDRYIDALDPMRLYFTAEEINIIYQQKHLVDDYLRSSKLRPFYEIFKRFRNNLIERTNFALTLIESEMDFTVVEFIELDREDSEWANNQNELDELLNEIDFGKGFLATELRSTFGPCL